jgi:hypothetical protein
MGIISNAFINGIKSSAGQAELAQYHNNFNQFLVNNPNSYSQGTDDEAEVRVYGNGAAAWVNIALNRKMLDVSNVEFFFVDKNGERIDWMKVPEDIRMPFDAGYAGMSINQMLGTIVGHEDLCGNALFLKSTDANRYTQMANVAGQFIPITPGNFKIELNAKGTAIDYYTITWKDGTQIQVAPDRVVQFKRNTILNPFIGIGLISQGRALVESVAVARQYYNNFLEKDGTPDLIYIDKDAKGLQPNMIKAKGEQLRAEYNAGKYANSIMYAPGDADIKSFAISASDLQFIEAEKMNAEQVISLMESTGSVLGIADAQNRASAGVLSNNYFGIVNSRVDHLVDTINKQHCWMVKGNEKKAYSLSSTPYPTGDVDQINKAIAGGLLSPAEGAKNMGYPVDIKNEATKALYINRGIGTLQYAFDTVPMSFGGLADDIENVKKKPIILDYIQSE